MTSKSKNIIRLQDYSTDYMSVAEITRHNLIVSQPVRLDYDLWLVVKCGSVRIASEIVVADIPASTFSVFGGNKILEVLDVSEDFRGDVFILSKKFQNDLGISEFLSLKLRFNISPSILLDKRSMDALEEYHRMAVNIISLTDNPYRWLSLLNLTRAFYYGGGYYFFQGENRPYKDDSTLTRFFILVEKHGPGL